MISTSMFKYNKFIQVAAMAVVMGLGLGGPAAAQSINMTCETGNVASMEAAIDGTFCCQYMGVCAFFGGDVSQCTLADGALQDCCDATSDTGDQTSCLCGEVSGYSDTLLGFTPSGC